MIHPFRSKSESVRGDFSKEVPCCHASSKKMEQKSNDYVRLGVVHITMRTVLSYYSSLVQLVSPANIITQHFLSACARV